MDLTTSPKCFHSPALFASRGEPLSEGNTSFYKKSKETPFADTFPDPLCKLNLKETSEFVRSFPMAASNNTTESRSLFDDSAQRREGIGSVSVTQRRLVDTPSTPGRPIFSFSVGNFAKKNFPSKWDDAEKWLISSSDSPVHSTKQSSEPSKVSSKQCDDLNLQMAVFADKCRVTEEKFSKTVSSIHHNSARVFNGVSASGDTALKDKFTDNGEPISNLRYSEPTREGFLFRNSAGEAMKDAATEVVDEIKHRDFGTEMTPLGSSTTSRCHTPFKSSSPARHNTPAGRSGPLALESSNSTNNTIDITQLQECHLAKLQLGTQFDSVVSNWSSREEEEEEISKSLRHFEAEGCRKSASESRAATWEEEEKNKCCLRYQREEAKILAWVNLQSAKAEAQSRKLEVKIQKMKANLEEKLMKRMSIVHRKAEEWRATAQLQHSEQMHRVTEQTQKTTKNRHNLPSHVSRHSSCGCFPCNN